MAMVGRLQQCLNWRPTALEPVSETLIVCLVPPRVFMTILSPVLAFEGCGASFVRNSVSLLLSPPYAGHIGFSLLFTFFTLVLFSTWLLVILLFSLFNAKRSQLQLRSRFKFIVVGIVDLAFAGLILTGIMLLSRVGIVTDCMREFDEEEENQRIFVLAHKLGYAGSPQEVCQSFEFDWRWLNGLCALAFVSSYFEIFSDPRLDHCLNAIAIMRVLFAPLGVTAIFAGKLGYIFTKRILPSLRYQYYMARRRWLRHQSTTFDAVEIPDRTPYIPQGAPDTSQPKLAQIFNIEHILLGVVDNLCYEDVINLGLTSRGVREAVYPARDLDYRIPKLRKHCCDQPTKHSCYYCCKTVCYGCSGSRFLPDLRGKRHVTHCEPYCNICYRTHYLASHRRNGWHRCHCLPRRQTQSFHSVCRTCSVANYELLQNGREKCYERQARELSISGTWGRPKCSHCDKEISAGEIIFWICKSCKRECRDRIHPAYVGKQDDDDVGM